jgi:hypothetical protein
LPRGGPAARRPRRWSTHLLPWTNVPKSACKRIELSPGSFAALTGEYPANHANLPALTGFFASRRSPVRSRLAPLSRTACRFHVSGIASGSSRIRRRVHLGCSRSATEQDPRPSWAPALIPILVNRGCFRPSAGKSGHSACWALKRHCGRCPWMAASGGQQPARARRWLLAKPGSLADRQRGLMRASGELRVSRHAGVRDPLESQRGYAR